MRPRTFRLKQVRLTRTFYPEVGCWASGSVAQIRCHVLMAWACYGDRSSEHVVDHRCQVNKQNFAEGNLEYVTRGENARRHHVHVRENKARNEPLYCLCNIPQSMNTRPRGKTSSSTDIDIRALDSGPVECTAPAPSLANVIGPPRAHRVTSMLLQKDCRICIRVCRSTPELKRHGHTTYAI